jgi:uncharacterized protein YbjT (DUF2867 family)
MAGLAALIAGATGLVGSEVLARLLGDVSYESVTVITRRPLAVHAASGKLHLLVTDFERQDWPIEPGVQHVYCALGTTMSKAGSREAFRRVDHDYPLRLAELARAAGASHFSLVSAVGADRRSLFHYSRVKGEVEEALSGLSWPSLAVFRPSLIDGQRAESRPLERLSGGLLRLAPTSWRPVAAADIAAAMIVTALRSPPGVTIVESRDIPGLARAYARYEG